MIGELSGLSCSVLWAFVSSAMRSASEKINPLAVNGLRCLAAAATLAVLLLALGRAEALFTMSVGPLITILASGAISTGVGDSLLVRSSKAIGYSRALPLSSTTPLITMVIAVTLLGERVTWLMAAGVISALIGLYLIAFPHPAQRRTSDLLSTPDWRGMAMALGAACCYAVSASMLKPVIVNNDAIVAAFLRTTIAGVLIWSLQGVRSGFEIPPGLDRRGGIMLAIAGMVSGFSNFFFVTSIALAGAAKATLLSSVSPLFGLPISTFWLKEKVTPALATGTLLSILGICLVLWG